MMAWFTTAEMDGWLYERLEGGFVRGAGLLPPLPHPGINTAAMSIRKSSLASWRDVDFGGLTEQECKKKLCGITSPA